MTSLPRQVLVSLIAFALSLAAAGAALLSVLDGAEISSSMALPRSAILTPMIAVVLFWAAVRATGVPLAPIKTFLYGAILIYSLLYFFGRATAFTAIPGVVGLPVALILLYGFALFAVRSAQKAEGIMRS